MTVSNKRLEKSVAILALLGILFFIVMAIGAIYIVLKIINVFMDPDQKMKKILHLKLSIPLFIIGLLGFVDMVSASYISPTEAGVLENQTTGSLQVIGTGLHVFPFDPKVVPLVTNVTTYSFSSKSDGENSLILGEKNDITKRVASASISPGNPVVYFWAKVVAVPNKNELITLHRRYGKGYLDGYVRDNFESAIKTIQGPQVFTFMANNRAEFEESVRVELQRRLGLETGGSPLLTVSFVNVLDYDYTKEVNDQLNQIVKAENDAISAAARVKSATQDALAVREKANGDRDAAIAKAEGDRQAANKKSDSDLYAKQQEALGITAVQNALASSPTYIQLQQVQRWNGTLPQFFGGSEPIPFFNLPTGSTPTPAGSTK